MVFAVGAGTAELQPELDSPAGFARYKEIQQSGEAAAMLVIPNACLIRAAKNYVVDPGIPMQGAPYSSAVGNLGVDPWGVEDVILTHMHFDHVGGLMEFPGRRVLRPRDRTRRAVRRYVVGPARHRRGDQAHRRRGRDRAGRALDAARRATPTG